MTAFFADDPMNADVLTTRVADGIAVITLGSARLIYFDAEMGDALTEALNGFAGDADVRGRRDNRPVAPRSRAAGCAGNRWRFI